MHFHHIPNAAISKANDRPMMQKEVYAVSPALQQYLHQHKKDTRLPLAYKELLHYKYTNAIKDENGKHTHWERVVYDETMLASLKEKLQALYGMLCNDNKIEIVSIDFCEFANSMPFRINITSNGKRQRTFYIKSADASRVYGLELEQLLTSNRINFLYHQNTLVEEHIDGTPGDDFLTQLERLSENELKQLAIAFIAFNERCFARLLGDMRSYNFVVLHYGAEGNAFMVKAIDFDQQCYEGRLNLYLPQFYKENHPYVQLATQSLGSQAIEAVRKEERQQLADLYVKNQQRLIQLLAVMDKEELSENYKIVSLRKELNEYHQTHNFNHCNTMGALVQQQLKELLQPLIGTHAFSTGGDLANGG